MVSEGGVDGSTQMAFVRQEAAYQRHNQAAGTRVRGNARPNSGLACTARQHTNLEHSGSIRVGMFLFF